jgi:hypothetical protein
MLAALIAESPHPAAAQSAPCTVIQDDAERLACYDRALRGTSPAPAAPTPAAEASAAPVTQAPAPVAQTPAFQAPAVQAPAAPASQAAPASAAPRAPAANAAKDIVPILVVSVRTLPGRETSFTTQDGAMWVQTDSQRIYGLPDTPFEAELKPGAVGSTFLVPKIGSRAIRVKLVQR